MIEEAYRITYFKWKDIYWIQAPKISFELYKYLLPFNSIEDYSPQTIKKLGSLNRNTVENLLLIKDKNIANGILHRRNLILEKMERLKTKEFL